VPIRIARHRHTSQRQRNGFSERAAGAVWSASREHHWRPNVSAIGRLQRIDIGAAGFSDGDEIGAAPGEPGPIGYFR